MSSRLISSVIIHRAIAESMSSGIESRPKRRWRIRRRMCIHGAQFRADEDIAARQPMKQNAQSDEIRELIANGYEREPKT